MSIWSVCEQPLLAEVIIHRIDVKTYLNAMPKFLTSGLMNGFMNIFFGSLGTGMHPIIIYNVISIKSRNFSITKYSIPTLQLLYVYKV